MFRRSPRVVPIVTAATAGLFLFAAVLPAQPPIAKTEPKSPTELRTQQEQNAKQFAEFKTALLRLAQKLQRSDKPEDQERAKVILAALDLAAKENVDNQFQKLVAGMSKGGGGIRDVDELLSGDAQLTKTLQDILTILMTDDETARLKAEIARLEAFLKEAKDIKRRQDTLRALTEAKKQAADRLSKNQNDLAKQTKDLSERMGGGKKGETGDQSPPKADPKSEAKEGDSAAEAKPDTAEPKSDPKDGHGEGEGDGKKPPESDAGAAEPKPGPDGKDGSPKEGTPKEGDGSDPKDGQPGEPRDGGDAKGSPKGESKAQGAGKGEGKSADGQKGGEAKGKESKPGDTQQADGKKGGGQPGQPGQQGQQGGQQGGQQQAQQPQTPGRKQVQEAYPHQEDAAEKLNRDKRPDAGKGQDKAIERLAEAIKELEKRLKQLREEEMLKLLANLEARCKRMLAMQIEVYEATKAIDATVAKNAGKKDVPEIQKAQQQGDKENEIVAEADRTLKLLESEGTAVAFAKVLEEVRQDMANVQRRLAAAYVDKDTQEIEQNIIAMLKDMVEALKRQQQEIQQQQQQPPPPGQQQPNQKLINLLAELKLIRSLQVQVNQRTKMYGDKEKSEQARDPILRDEIRQLSARQVKLQDMIQKIATGANE